MQTVFFNKKEIKQSRTVNLSTLSKELLSKLNVSPQKAVQLALEKGASSWLTTLPVKEHGFSLHKTVFHDALLLCNMVGCLLTHHLIMLV